MNNKERRAQDGHQRLHGDGNHHIRRHRCATEGKQRRGEPGGTPCTGLAMATFAHGNSNHAQRQQQVASIRDSRPPRVVADGEGAATAIVVEGGLIDAVALHTADIIHGDSRLFLTFCCGDDDMADIVGRRRAIVVIFDFEILQCQIERHLVSPRVSAALILHPEEACHLALAQMRHTPAACEVGGQRTG